MVKVNKDLCLGCGACVAVCPQAFELVKGKAHAKSDKPKCIDDAIEACPVSAISK